MGEREWLFGNKWIQTLPVLSRHVSHVSWGNLEYKAKITVLVIDKSACLVKTSWSTDKEPLLMDSGLELFLFCPFPYVSSTCLLCMNIHSCNDGFFVQLGKKKTRFYISRYPSDSAKISFCLCCCCFLGWSVKMVRSCLLNPVSDSVSVPQRAASPWFGAVSGRDSLDS